MFKQIMFFILVLLMAGCNFYSTDPPIEKGTLVYEDTFNTFNNVSWQHVSPNSQRKLAFNNPDNVSVQDGALNLSMSLDDDNIVNTAMLRSTALYQYGYFEARVKFPTEYGAQSAFWLTNPNYFPNCEGNPAFCGNETTVEHISRNPTTLYYVMYWDGYLDNIKNIGSNTPITQDWITIGINWTPEKYEFYVDDILIDTIDENISQTPQNINLTIEVSSWSGCSGDLLTDFPYKVIPERPFTLNDFTCEGQGILDAQFPDIFQVDYVRVYQ